MKVVKWKPLQKGNYPLFASFSVYFSLSIQCHQKLTLKDASSASTWCQNRGGRKSISPSCKSNAKARNFRAGGFKGDARDGLCDSKCRKIVVALHLRRSSSSDVFQRNALVLSELIRSICGGIAVLLVASPSFSLSVGSIKIIRFVPNTCANKFELNE